MSEFRCANTPITMGLLVELEEVISTEKLRDLLAGKEITLSFREQSRAMRLITNLPYEEVKQLSAEEVAMELGFFSARLALSTHVGRTAAMSCLLLATSQSRATLGLANSLLNSVSTPQETDSSTSAESPQKTSPTTTQSFSSTSSSSSDASASNTPA